MASNIWYVPAQGAGFTSDPEQALKDLTGAPIIAPGHLRRIVKVMRKRIRAEIEADLTMEDGE